MEHKQKDTLRTHQTTIVTQLSSNPESFNTLIGELDAVRLLNPSSRESLQVDIRYCEPETIKNKVRDLIKKLNASLNGNCFNIFCTALREVGFVDLANLLEEAAPGVGLQGISSQSETIPYQKMLTKHHSYLADQLNDNQSVFNAILNHMFSKEVLPSRTHTTFRIAGQELQPVIDDKIEKFLKFLNKPDQSHVFDVFDAGLKKEGLGTVSDRLRK